MSRRSVVLHLLQVALASALLCAPLACAEVKDLMALRSALSEQYGAAAVNIHVRNGERSLALTLDPQAVADRDGAEVALEAARSARALYARPVDRWIVVFGTETGTGGFHFSWNVGRYEFANSEL